MNRHVQLAARPVARRSGGFTLVELLVTMGIIAVLASLLLPMAARARRQAVRTKALSNLQTLSTGIEAYQQVYRSYPVFDNTILTTQNDHSGPTTATGFKVMAVDYGSHALYSALVCVWSPRNGGEKYGPFVNVDNIRVDNVNMWVLDDNKVQVLYIPASLPVPNIRGTIGPTNTIKGFVDNGAGSVAPLYDHRAVIQTLATPGGAAGTTYLKLGDLQQLLGDSDKSGTINGTEQPVTQQPYLLWMAGPDGAFGLNTNTTPTTDDITNFDIPAQFIRK